MTFVGEVVEKKSMDDATTVKHSLIWGSVVVLVLLGCAICITVANVNMPQPSVQQKCLAYELEAARNLANRYPVPPTLPSCDALRKQ